LVGGGLSGAPIISAAGPETIVLWTQNAASCEHRVYAAVRPGAGALAKAVALSRYHECDFEEGQLALAGSARYLIAAWVEHGALYATTVIG
jgi:hypothetical protein